MTTSESPKLLIPELSAKEANHKKAVYGAITASTAVVGAFVAGPVGLVVGGLLGWKAMPGALRWVAERLPIARVGG